MVCHASLAICLQNLNTGSLCSPHRLQILLFKLSLLLFLPFPLLASFPKVKVLSHSVVSNSLRPHRLQPATLLCPWNSLDKNTGVGSHFLLQGIFPTQGSNLGFLHCRQILYCLSYQGSPRRERSMWTREDSVRYVCLYVTMPQAGGCRASWTALLGVSAPGCGHVQEGRRLSSLGSYSATSRCAAQTDTPFLHLPRMWFMCIKLTARLGASREDLMAMGLQGCEADSYILDSSSPRIVTFHSFQDLIQPTSGCIPTCPGSPCTPAVMGCPGPQSHPLPCSHCPQALSERESSTQVAQWQRTRLPVQEMREMQV